MPLLFRTGTTLAASRGSARRSEPLTRFSSHTLFLSARPSVPQPTCSLPHSSVFRPHRQMPAKTSSAHSSVHGFRQRRVVQTFAVHGAATHCPNALLSRAGHDCRTLRRCHTASARTRSYTSVNLNTTQEIPTTTIPTPHRTNVRGRAPFQCSGAKRVVATCCWASAIHRAHTAATSPQQMSATPATSSRSRKARTTETTNKPRTAK
jgi:hypothetical protein